MRRIAPRDVLDYVVAHEAAMRSARGADSLEERRRAYVAAAWLTLRRVHSVPARACSHESEIARVHVRLCLRSARAMRRCQDLLSTEVAA